MALLAVAVVATVEVGGAGAGGDGAPSAALDRPVAGATVEPPIDRALYGEPAVRHRIALADHQLVRACMVRHGFTYRVPPPSASPDPRPQLFGREPGAAPHTPAGSDDSAANSPAYARALLGDPERRVTARGTQLTVSGPADGCLAEAKDHLLGADRARWMRTQILLFETAQAARADLDADPVLRAATERWRTCVRGAGFDWEDPRSAQADRTPAAEAADLRCKASTNYLATAYAGLAAAQQRRLRETPELLPAWTSMLRKQSATAEAVLG